MLVQIDSREKNRIKSAKEYYEQQGLEVEICELEIGDYLFDNKVVFEFKTIQDFIASIIDNRVFNEAINQAENYDYHFIIIQGNESERAKQIAISRNYCEISYYQYLGAIASLNRYTTVIESYSPHIQESYYRMQIQAQKCLRNKPIVKKFPRKHKNPALNWLCHDIYGINYKTAEKIVRELDLHTLTDLFILDKTELTSIEGIGDKIAEKIITSIEK